MQISRIGLIACAMLSAAGALKGQEEGIQWLGNYKEALTEARKTGKPIFLEYRCEP
jgi:hypothetical protein